MLLCVGVCALTLCLYEMKYLCSDLSCHVDVPPHGLPIHPLQLAQQHQYPGVTGNTKKTQIVILGNVCSVINKNEIYSVI